jgi:hypothetical protein
MNIHATLVLALLTAAAHPEPRSNANYNVPADTTDSGGGRAASASYTDDGSVGGVAGISTVASPAETEKAGYVGQLYDVTGLTLTSGSSTVNEGATLQLGAWQALDDASFIAVPAASVSWSVQSGPLVSISTGGLATAGAVYQNTAAVAQGIFGGFLGSYNLTVFESIADNFGGYAGDGVGDAWQVQYFGQPPNANAGPNVDFDGTGQTNLFKYIAGLNPLDGSRFALSVAAVPGQPGQKKLIFSPIVAGRTYVVKAKADLLTPGGWLPITASAPSDNGSERTITDLNASGARKFYQVEVTRP